MFCYSASGADKLVTLRPGTQMHIDLPTMYTMTAFVTVVAGLLLLFSWLQDRSITSLALWGISFLAISAGGELALMRGNIPDFLSVLLGNSLAMAAYGLMWCAARSFEDRKPNYLLAFTGSAIWIVLCQFETIYASQYMRILFTTAVAATYTFLAAAEYLRPRDKALVSRWPAIILLIFHGVVCVIRLALIDVLPFPAGTLPYDPAYVPLGAFTMLINNFCLSFLIVNMAKERAELRQRETAQVDALTGVPNRRTFLDIGERVLQRTLAEGQPVAVLILDLDFFKNINDTFGHQSGDRVLCAFCDTATDALRPNDLFARMGGEEFACLLPGASEGNALAVAERIRGGFEGRRTHVGAHVSMSTVSIGVAMAQDIGADLGSLLAAADRALYLAKANGRNRIERARPAVMGETKPQADCTAPDRERISSPPIQPATPVAETVTQAA
jgi:diguanylate cyclase (GGDEF)-like protein